MKPKLPELPTDGSRTQTFLDERRWGSGQIPGLAPETATSTDGLVCCPTRERISAGSKPVLIGAPRSGSAHRPGFGFGAIGGASHSDNTWSEAMGIDAPDGLTSLVFPTYNPGRRIERTWEELRA